MLKNILLLIISGYVLMGLALFIFQRSFVFFPVEYQSSSQLAEVSLNSEDHNLQGFVANAGKSRAIVYFGGNAEQIVYALDELREQFPDIAVIGFYYRGYGGSEGEPSEKALFADALNIYDEMAKDYDKVYAIGRSLGTGVATYLAQQRKVDKLVLVTPFDSIVNIAEKIYWYFPVHWLMLDKFDSASRAPEIQSPVLVLAAEFDQVVVSERTDKLVEKFDSGIVDHRVLRGVDHNNIQTSPEYYPLVTSFLEM